MSRVPPRTRSSTRGAARPQAAGRPGIRRRSRATIASANRERLRRMRGQRKPSPAIPLARGRAVCSASANRVRARMRRAAVGGLLARRVRPVAAGSPTIRRRVAQADRVTEARPRDRRRHRPVARRAGPRRRATRGTSKGFRFRSAQFLPSGSVLFSGDRAIFLFASGPSLRTRLASHFAITNQCAHTVMRPGPQSSNGSSIPTRPSAGRS
jgi:hypothetical protein